VRTQWTLPPGHAWPSAGNANKVPLAYRDLPRRIDIGRHAERHDQRAVPADHHRRHRLGPLGVLDRGERGRRVLDALERHAEVGGECAHHREQ
jgi:hypothetical protein